MKLKLWSLINNFFNVKIGITSFISSHYGFQLTNRQRVQSFGDYISVQHSESIILSQKAFINFTVIYTQSKLQTGQK